MNIALPFSVLRHRLNCAQDEDESIRDNLELIIGTPVGSVITDLEFGFVLNNMRFEILDEDSGTIHDSNAEDTDNEALYHEKLSGTSKNFNTYAAELKTVVERYEPRLRDVRVSMTYVRLEHKIYISLRGTRRSDDTEFQFKTHFNTWK